MDSFSWVVAYRNLRTSMGQTLLTACVVAISVLLVIFLTAIIRGVEKRVFAATTDSIAHVVVRAPDRDPVALWDPGIRPAGDRTVYVGDRVKIQQVRTRVDDWMFWLPQLETIDPNVIQVSPVIEGQGVLTRGAKEQGVKVTGVDPVRHDLIVGLADKMVTGRFKPLTSGEVVVGAKLAENFGLDTGDRVRIIGSDGLEETFNVVGIFRTGSATIDEGTVIVPLRDGQALFKLGRSITAFHLKLRRIFEAETLARRIESSVPLRAESWMALNARLMASIRSQSDSTVLVITFTAIAAACAVAAIMVMAVVSRITEIGVLKAIGATSRQVLAVFAIQGALLSACGAVIGAASGTALCLWLGSVQLHSQQGMGEKAQPLAIDLPPSLVINTVIVAVIIGFLAAIYPARRASKVNPIEVIRGQ